MAETLKINFIYLQNRSEFLLKLLKCNTNFTLHGAVLATDIFSNIILQYNIFDVQTCHSFVMISLVCKKVIEYAV